MDSPDFDSEVGWIRRDAASRFGAQKVEVEGLKAGDFTRVLRLRAGKPCFGGRASCIAKLCRGPLVREASVYEAAERLPWLPACYGSFPVGESERLLYLEDVSGTLLRESPAQERLPEVLRALRDLSRAHSAWEPLRFRLPAARSLPGEWVDFAQALFDRTRGRRADAGHPSLLEHALTRCAEGLAQQPMGLVHGDLYGDNVLLTPTGVRFLDWGFCHFGCGAVDAVTLLEPHPRKNGPDRLSDDERVRLYAVGYLGDEGGEDLGRARREIACARVLVCLDLLAWLCFRIEFGAWRGPPGADALARQRRTTLEACRTVLALQVT